MALQHILDSLGSLLGLELDKCLDTIVVLCGGLILGEYNDLLDLAVVPEDLIHDHRSDLGGGAHVVLSIEHGDEEGLGGVYGCSQFVVEGVAEVHAAAVDLGVPRILEEVHHLLGRLQRLHLHQGLILLTEHDDVADTTEGGNEVLDR